MSHPIEDMENFVDYLSILDWLRDVWAFQITSVDGYPITVGKLVKGITLMIMGYFLCRSISREIEKKLLTRLDIDSSLRHTLRTIIFYFLLVVLTLFILRLLNIPVTVFTVIGGALAIGVGLGSQNIVNNFISGLIMMIERPVKIGDIVELDGLAGRVEYIGPRSTRIKTMSNTHMVVPNSTFLEKNVLNWTLSDDIVRLKVSVGVAYGTDSRLVEATLLESLKGIDKILKYPEPIVFFKDFADSSLVFDTHIWVKMYDPLQRFKLESEVRHSINAIFAEKNIVISFPQRDIHLHAEKPVQVQITDKS